MSKHFPVPAALALLLAGAACRQPAPSAVDAGAGVRPAGARTEEDLPSFEELFARVSPSVVNVSATHALPIPPDLLPRREAQLLGAMARSLGSGFVLDRAGHVVTCSSVIQDAEVIEVQLASGRSLPATLVASDEATDLAVLQVDPRVAPPPLALAPAPGARPGDWVAAFGYPFGLSHSISAGIVSANYTAEMLRSAHGRVLSDAAVNPGCNGGPLVDTAGRVIGILQLPPGAEGELGQAVPIADALATLESLARGQRPPHPWLGLAVQAVDPALATAFDLPKAEGALVSRVVPEGPGARAGIRVGDVVTAVDDQPIADPQALIERVRRAPIGRSLTLQLVRAGKPLSVRITPQAAQPR